VEEEDFMGNQALHHQQQPEIKKLRRKSMIGTITLVLPNKHQNMKQQLNSL
jgi:hypothetical protein